MGQLHAQHGCLNGVHAAVPAKLVMVIAPGTAMVAQLTHVLGHPRTGSGDDARVSIGAQVFGGIETEGSGYTERARAAPVPLGDNRLRGIFHNGNFKLLGMFLNDAVKSFHVGALSIKMHWENRPNIFGLPRAELRITESP